jgi:arginase
MVLPQDEQGEHQAEQADKRWPEKCGTFPRASPMTELHFLGVPFNADGTPPEMEHPPQHLRDAGLLDRLSSSRSIHDCGDLPIPAADGVRDSDTNVLNWSSWQAVTGCVAESIREILAAGGWPLVVGGDCSILVGIMAAAGQVQAPCGLFFVDGHGDFHTPATSPTGEPADMELAVLTGRAPSPAGAATGVLLDDEDVVVFGARERDGIDAAPIRVLDFARLTQDNLATAVKDAATAISNLSVWLHFDVDVIDATLMPVLFPAGTGLTLDQTATVLDTLLKTGRVIGMDVACFHPNLDHSGAATTALVDLLTKLLAK